MKDYKNIIQKAKKAKEKAYAPYSSFHVGACVYMDDDQYYTGCNIENASYGATICAEQVAITKAISSGATRIKQIAIVGDQSFTYPCGICRQIINEFSDKDTIVIIAKTQEDYKILTMEQILPHAFGPTDLGGNHV